MKKELSEDKKKLTELKKELETIEERFAFGKIPDNLYDKFSEKLEKQILELEQKIDKGNFSTANRSKKITNLIKKVQNLDEMWGSGDYAYKKRLQKYLFPDGMVVDPVFKQLRTDNANNLFSIIKSFSESCK